jgi:protein-S-isoprenylcysteine O-methyltransferase Ste14
MGTISHAVIPVLWAIWILYWIVSARGTKQTQRHEDARSWLSHHAPLIAGAVLLGIPDIFGATMEGEFIPHTATWLWIANVLVAAGLGFAVAARIWLGGNWSSNVTLKQGHELIRNGPYALVRHPIYTGLLLALLGTAIMVGKWRAVIGLALIVVAFLRKLSIEERFMAEQFGEDYARYRTDVAALIPFVV